jgi:hypothetical protein
MTFLEKLKILIGRNLISSATGRWYPKCPPEAYFHNCMSFSQCGEDLAVVNILMQLGHQGPVHYVDVGCFHPVQYSNTYFFYLRGGSGLVIDMNESHRSEFGRLRPRDKFLAEVVSDLQNPVHLSANGSPTDSIVHGTNVGKTKIKQPRLLADLLAENWPQDKQIDLLDIDCEGHDLEVLQSNNWEKYRPKIVILELFYNCNNEVIIDFMDKKNYKLVSQIRDSGMFISK